MQPELDYPTIRPKPRVESGEVETLRLAWLVRRRYALDCGAVMQGGELFRGRSVRKSAPSVPSYSLLVEVLALSLS